MVYTNSIMSAEQNQFRLTSCLGLKSALVLSLGFGVPDEYRWCSSLRGFRSSRVAPDWYRTMSDTGIRSNRVRSSRYDPPEAEPYRVASNRYLSTRNRSEEGNLLEGVEEEVDGWWWWWWWCWWCCEDDDFFFAWFPPVNIILRLLAANVTLPNDDTHNKRHDISGTRLIAYDDETKECIYIHGQQVLSG